MKKYDLWTALLFCAFLGGFSVWGALLPDRDFSPYENRVLAQRPVLRVSDFRLPPSLTALEQGGNFFSGRLMAQWEGYVTDQFPLRDEWIAGKAWMERLSGKQENNGVYFAGENTLIQRLPEPDPDRLDRNMSAVATFIRNCPVPANFALIPMAAQIWADRLPDGAPSYDTKSLYQLASASVPGFIDLRGTLAAHAVEPLYYRTDHHWTSLGAYYAYEAMAGKLDYEPIPLSSAPVTVSDSFYGTLYSASGSRWTAPDEIRVYVRGDGVTVMSYAGEKHESRPLYDFSKLRDKDQYAFFLGGQQPFCSIQTPNHSKPKLLILRDSYTDSLVPFLTQSFSEIDLVDLRYYTGSVTDLIHEHRIDRVLVLYSTANFLSDTNLSALCPD